MMGLQKTIVTPAGTTLGTYGYLQSWKLTSTNGAAVATSITVAVYNTEADKKAGKPPADTYTYPLKNPITVASATDQTALLAYLQTTLDTGVWGAPLGQVQWRPGWTGATVVAD